jgi:hypothetical protein
MISPSGRQSTLLDSRETYWAKPAVLSPLACSRPPPALRCGDEGIAPLLPSNVDRRDAAN